MVSLIFSPAAAALERADAPLPPPNLHNEAQLYPQRLKAAFCCMCTRLPYRCEEVHAKGQIELSLCRQHTASHQSAQTWAMVAIISQIEALSLA